MSYHLHDEPTQTGHDSILHPYQRV
ncbi:MAG: hypothetical protein HG422_09290 [Prevotella sp.]|nr:hypothetical protein [Prevotella sp.]